MRTLLVQGLFNQGANGSIERLNLCADALTQFCWGKVQVQAGRFGAFVPRKQGDVIEIDPCSFQDRTALVAQGMRGQCRQMDCFPHPFHDLIKSANRERTAWVTRGLRQKNYPKIFTLVGRNEGAAISFQVDTHQMQDGCRDRDMAHPSALGDLWSDGYQTTCPVKVIDPQRHQFLSPQSSIVGEQNHGAGPGILMENNMLNKLLPDFIGGHPG